MTRPARLAVAVRLKLRIFPDQLAAVVERRAVSALEAFFDPLTGGLDHRGWPFGAPVYRADIYTLMDRVEGVDSVDLTAGTDDVLVVGDPLAADRQIKPAPTAKYVGLSLEPNELVAFSATNSTIECQPAKTTIPA